VRVRGRGALVEAGRERVDDRRAPGGLHGDQSGEVTGEQAELAQLQECLVDRDDPDAATGRVEDDVGCAPAELLDDLEPHRLLALEAVRLAQRRGVLVARPVRHRGVDRRTGVADQAVHEVEFRARHHALAPGDHRGVHRHGDQGTEPRPCRVGRPRRAGVAVGRHRDAGDSQLDGPRDPDRRAAGLERPRRHQALVLHP